MLWKFLSLTKLPWIVLADWDCEPADLLPTGWLTQTSGVLTPKGVAGTCFGRWRTHARFRRPQSFSYAKSFST